MPTSRFFGEAIGGVAVVLCGKRRGRLLISGIVLHFLILQHVPVSFSVSASVTVVSASVSVPNVRLLVALTGSAFPGSLSAQLNLNIFIHAKIAAIRSEERNKIGRRQGCTK